MSDRKQPGDAEFRVLLKDREWRLQHLYRILDESGEMVPYKARPEQLSFRQRRHRRNFVPKARKLGISTEIVLLNLDECLYTSDLTCGIVDLKREDAQEKLNIARRAWEAGPSHPNPGIANVWQGMHDGNPLVTDNCGLLEWRNGSRMHAGTSFTGRTPQRMHLSEYGPISAQMPKKAAQIQRGSINAVPPGGIVDIETTMEGGRIGKCYHYFRIALKSAGLAEDEMSAVDWQLHFFPWVGHPSYVLPGFKPLRAETMEYFAELKEKYGLTVSEAQQAWYERRALELGDEMWQQYPTVIEECDRAVVSGAIYKQMTALRARGQVRAFAKEQGMPMFTFWDLGGNDNMAGWLIQPLPKGYNVLDWSAGEGAGAPGAAEVVRRWEREHGPAAGHFLPHDAHCTDKGSGKTFLTQFVDSGIPRHLVQTVPRTPDVWVGIGEVRKRLEHCWFHARCDLPVTDTEGDELPSGVARMEGYRTQSRGHDHTATVPLDDICAHTADAFRTFAEADAHGLIVARTGIFSRGGAWRAPQVIGARASV